MPQAQTAKGIVIEIGGDVAGLQKALGSINSEMRSTQNELKQVERLLKLDPQNTELLAQKQKLLADAVQDAKLKLDALTQAQGALADAANGGSEKAQAEYRKLEREIVATGESLKSMEGELQTTNKALETNAGSAQGLSGKMQKLSDDITAVDDSLGGKLTKSVEAFGAAAAAAGALAIKSFVDFSAETIKVRTLLDESVLSYDAAKESILEWSGTSAQGANEVAEAMYNALSAGVQTADIQTFMAQATQTATAGFTDAATSVDVLTTILNSYGMSAAEVTAVSDKLLLTQEKGKVTVGQLSSGLGNLVGVASSAGVSLEEVLSAVSALTASGQAPSSAINSLKAAISNIIKPSGEAAEMAHKLHLRFDAQTLSSKGLAEMMTEVSRKTGGSTEKMAKLFGSVEALNAMLILTGDGNKVFTDTLTGMNNAAGKTAETFDLIASDTGFKFKQALEQMNGALIQVGDTLSPLLSAVASVLSVLANINPGVLVIVGTLLTLATGLIQVCKAFKSLSGLGGKVGEFFGGINTQTIKTIAIVLSVVAALIALAAIIAVIIGRGKDLQNTMSSIGNSVADVQNSVNNAGRAPHYATGTEYHMGGRALVGEYGPELVELPAGAKVRTASDTRRMMAAQPANETYYITIDAKNVREFNDIIRMAKSARQQRRAR